MISCFYSQSHEIKCATYRFKKTLRPKKTSTIHPTFHQGNPSFEHGVHHKNNEKKSNEKYKCNDKGQRHNKQSGNDCEKCINEDVEEKGQQFQRVIKTKPNHFFLQNNCQRCAKIFKKAQQPQPFFFTTDPQNHPTIANHSMNAYTQGVQDYMQGGRTHPRFIQGKERETVSYTTTITRLGFSPLIP